MPGFYKGREFLISCVIIYQLPEKGYTPGSFQTNNKFMPGSPIEQTYVHLPFLGKNGLRLNEKII
jgi:hypothetical protein